MKVIISVIFVLFTATLCFADNNIIEVEPISKNKKVISILYPENHVWVYERFLVQTNKLQVRLGRRIFEHKKQALKFLKPNKNFLGSQKINNVVSLNYVSTENRDKKIWQDKNQWSSEWEKKYSQWFKDNVTKDFFVKYNIATDCADAAIAFRWIFSRINSLPAGQTLAGTNTLFTNRSFKNSWNKYSRNSVWYKDKVFMASLRYLVNNTYTHSLNRDSYPVAITPEHLSEGSYRLTIGNTSGHTVLIHRQNVNDIPLSSLSSTVPKKVRSLSEAIFVPGRIENRKKGGLVKHLWIVRNGSNLVKLRPKSMPGFSLEQYDPEFGKENFSIAVIKRIDPNFNAVKIYKNIFSSTLDFINARVAVVNEGNAFCKVNDCAPGTQNYEDWSTPSRDKQLSEKMDQELDLYLAFSYVYDELTDVRKKLVEEKKIEILGEFYSYKFFKNIWAQKYFNSDPRVSLQRRWALSAKDFINVGLDRITVYNKDLQIKINQPKCDPVNCPKFSKAWANQLTVFERGVIKSYLDDLLNYCKWKEVPCSKYFLENLENINISGLSFYEYAKSIFIGSFDPQSSIADKKNRSSWDSVMFLDPKYIGQTKSYLVSQDNFGFSLTSMFSKIRQNLNIYGEILTSDGKSNSILYKSLKHDVIFLDLDSGESQVLVSDIEKEEIKRVYMFNKKVIFVTNKMFRFYDLSAGSPIVLQSDDLLALDSVGTFKNASSKIEGDDFHLVIGRLLYVINLVNNNIKKRLIPMQVKDDSFTIINISEKYIYLKNHSHDEFYRTIILNREDTKHLKVMLLDYGIDWFYGSDIYRKSIEDGSGFTLNKINNKYEFYEIKKCLPCSGYIFNSNIKYESEGVQKLLYWNGVEIIDYNHKYQGVNDAYESYVIEASNDGERYIMGKSGEQFGAIKFKKKYSYTRMTDLGLNIEYRSRLGGDLLMSFDADYIYSRNGSYIPFDSAVSLSYPEGTSEEYMAQYRFIDYIELGTKYSRERPNIVNSEIDHSINYTEIGSLFSASLFTFWVDFK